MSDSWTKVSQGEVLEAIDLCEGVKVRVADMLGVSRQTVDNYIRKWKSVADKFEAVTGRKAIEDISPSLYTYFIQDDLLGLTKIGVSSDVERRRSDLQIGCPQRLRVVAIIESKNASEIENALHKQFADKRYENGTSRGEWFELTQNDIEQAIRLYGGEFFYNESSK